MRRRVFKWAAICSLVLTVGSAALWAASYWRAYSIQHHGAGSSWYLTMNPGALWAEWVSPGRPQVPTLSFVNDGLIYPEENLFNEQIAKGNGLSPPIFHRWGFGYQNFGRIIITRIPFWFLTAVATLPAMIWLWAWRCSRLRPGFCRKCGYDLRASKERCPECGEAIPADLVKKPVA